MIHLAQTLSAAETEEVSSETETSGMPLTNAALFLFLTLCAYNFWRAVTLDPGFIPISQSKEQLKEVSVVPSVQARSS